MGKAALNEDQIAALRELIEASVAESAATDRQRRALVHAHQLGCSWDDLGTAVGVSRETVRGRVKSAQKHVAAADAAKDAAPMAATNGVVTVPGPMPAQAG